VQWREGKSNLSPMLIRGLTVYGHGAVDNLLARPERIAPYVDLRAVRSSWERFRAAPTPELTMAIWLPLVLDRGLDSGGPACDAFLLPPCYDAKT